MKIFIPNNVPSSKNSKQPIIGYESQYEIFINGFVRNIKTGNFLKPRIRGKQNQYFFVSLWSHNKEKHFYVHRLLAQHFIPNPENLPIVNHKDGDCQNNSLDNLEWCNQSHNAQHAIGLGNIPLGPDRYNAKFNWATVQTIRSQYPEKNQYELARKYKVAQGTIQKILTNRSYKE